MATGAAGGGRQRVDARPTRLRTYFAGYTW